MKTDAKRRAFLTATVAGLAALWPGIKLIELSRGSGEGNDLPGTDETRWGMLIDTEKCAVGCDACVTGCNEEHGLVGTERPETDAQWIRKVTLEDEQTGHVTSLPMLCQHCENPPCVDVCPTGASFKRADGIVLVDKHTCIGCRYCVLACPYKARSFIHETLTDQKSYSPRGKGTVEGCTLCVHRVDRGDTPACVAACNGDGAGAMVFGDLADPQSTIATRIKTTASRQVRADLNLNTGVRYQNL